MKYFGAGLLLLFIAFKLAGIIAWSWLWVLAPLWAPVSLWALLATPWYVYIWFFESESDKNARVARETLEAYAKALSRR